MGQNSSNDISSWLIHLTTIDSTNNYAMQLVQDGMAYHGLAVTADEQTQGKGQRGKSWIAAPNTNIALSLIIEPQQDISIYDLSFIIPVAVRNAIQSFVPECQLSIKWPNDIYVGNRKLAGILIENIFRGAHIKNSIIGVGINVTRQNFPDMEREPITLEEITTKELEKTKIIAVVRTKILATLQQEIASIVEHYNYNLWGKNQSITFETEQSSVKGKVVQVNQNFELVVENEQDSTLHTYTFGTVKTIF